MKITIIYGSSTGNTEAAASQLSKLMPESQVMEVTDADTTDFENCELLVLGTSTWGFGDLQDDWESALDKLRSANLTDKKVALFGLGDQDSYPSTFVDGLRPLNDAAKEAGAKLIGLWSAENYDFQDSAALEGDKLLGLALDEENQSELSDQRMKNWTEQLLNEMGH
ncbi:flavodoxin [uncultured Desulfuromonas sp.]|uniref:flavodoxin n=1 Tax=uncultured Desulfuromonas sp. TaxID=181013 RepID=UPI002AAB338B|nr:flavodoxin [uncultured Desulfuromonas sp.]